MGRLATVFNETLGRLEESFEQMRRFTADVSHELRTPLTAIRSVGEVGLRGHRDEAAYRSIIGSMLEEVDRLAEPGRSAPDAVACRNRSGEAVAPRRVDLRELAEEVATHLGVLAEEKRQSIAVEQRGRAGRSATGSSLRQALINLVDNAIKFTPGGRPHPDSRRPRRRASSASTSSTPVPAFPQRTRPHLRSLLSRRRR